MNDFSDLEAELKKLRPRAVSPDLTHELNGTCEVGLDRRPKFQPNCHRRCAAQAARFPDQLAWSWPRSRGCRDVLDPRTSESRLADEETECDRNDTCAIHHSGSAERTVSSGRRDPGRLQPTDEGLHFPDGADQPIRRVRSQKRETLQWIIPARAHRSASPIPVRK